MAELWNQVAESIQVAMHYGDYQEALHHIHMTLPLFHSMPLFEGQLLLLSAECYFQLGQLQVCLQHLIFGHQKVTPHPDERKVCKLVKL